MISIHELQIKKRKKYYGATMKVYRKCDFDYMIRMWADLHYLSELHTRTRLIPCNEEFRVKKAIPIFNSRLNEMRIKYPDIEEFCNFEYVVK